MRKLKDGPGVTQMLEVRQKLVRQQFANLAMQLDPSESRCDISQIQAAK